MLILTGLVGGEHSPGKASGTKKTKHGQLHPLSRVKELTNYTREWLSDNLVRFNAKKWTKVLKKFNTLSSGATLHPGVGSRNGEEMAK